MDGPVPVAPVRSRWPHLWKFLKYFCAFFFPPLSDLGQTFPRDVISLNTSTFIINYLHCEAGFGNELPEESDQFRFLRPFVYVSF
jgi:hypothetical protein